jgi:phospholipid/cholesterol/gamma-HCH transport system permease protein
MSFSTLSQPIVRVGLPIVSELGYLIHFAKDFFRWLYRPPFRLKLIIQQMEFMGVKSLPIIALTGIFTGMVFSLQTGYAFRLFHAETMVGSTVGLALTREIAPVFTALMVVARNGSSMAAELGSMRVTEQLDALETMAVNPIHYLVVPRIIAATLMTPLLCAVFSFIGIWGAYIVATNLLGIHPFYFMDRLEYYVDGTDVIGGLIKAAVFGFLLALISCYRGYITKGGSKGVGQATTGAVVMSSVMILVTDYFLTAWILEIFPD